MRLWVGALIGTLVVATRSGAAIGAPEADRSPMRPEPSEDASPAGPTVSRATPAKNPTLAHQRLVAAQDAERRGDVDAARGHSMDAKAQWTSAAAAYQQAIDAGDDVTVNYALALVEERLGHHVEAYKHLQIVATARVRPNLLKKVHGKLNVIARRVGTIKLAVSPDGAQVFVAGDVVGTTPLGDPLVLAPGQYTITLVAPGYQPLDTAVEVKAGSQTEDEIALEPIPIAVTSRIQELPPLPPERTSYAPLIIGGAVTVGFAVAATLTGLAAIHQHDIFVDPTTEQSDRKSAQSTGRLDAHVTDACIVGAIAAVAVTGGWYYFTAPNARESRAKLGVAPWIQPDASGLVVAGSF